MTGQDHTDATHHDGITGALRSPALPFERVHEDAVLADMVDALSTAPEPSSLRRHRRVVAFAAVTVASLGVGGIIAAGPGGFRPFINDDSPATTIFHDSVPAPAPDDPDDDVGDDVDNGTERVTTDPEIDCAEVDNATHGRTVSSAAKAPGSNRPAAQSECGKPLGSADDDDDTGDDDTGGDDTGDGDTGGGTERITTDPDFECAEGDNANHGRTVSSAAKDPGPNTAAAESECGKPIVSGNGEDDNVEGETGNGNDGVPGPPASTPGNPDPGPPASTPGSPDPGPPASTPNNGHGNGNSHGSGNGNGITTTTQPAG